MLYLSKNLKRFRIAKNLTQEDIAEFLCITPQSVSKWERGLSLSTNEKQKATTRAALCFLYLKCDKTEKASALAASLPHTRESREIIQPLISKGMSEDEIDKNIKTILLGDVNILW